MGAACPALRRARLALSLRFIKRKCCEEVLSSEYTYEVFFAAIQILLKAAPAFSEEYGIPAKMD